MLFIHSFICQSFYPSSIVSLHSVLSSQLHRVPFHPYSQIHFPESLSHDIDLLWSHLHVFSHSAPYLKEGQSKIKQVHVDKINKEWSEFSDPFASISINLVLQQSMLISNSVISKKKTTNKEYIRFGIKAEKSVYHQNRKCPHLDHESNYKGTLSSGIHSKIELLLQIQRNRDS